MIQQFGLKDFKGHKGDRDFRFPGITIISGTNNSGKSSVLQAVYLLTQNKTHRFSVLALNEKLRLGTFSEVLNKEKKSDETLELFVEFDKVGLNLNGIEQLSIQMVYKKQSSLEFNSVPLYGEQDFPILSAMYIQFKKIGEPVQEIELTIVETDGEIYYEIKSEKDHGFCKLNGLVPEPVYYKNLSSGERIICSADLNLIRQYLFNLSSDNIKYLKAYRLDDFRETNRSFTPEIGLSGEYTAEKIATSWNLPVDFNNEKGEKLKFSQVFDSWIQQFLGEEYRVRSQFVDRGEYKIVVEETTNGLKFTLDQVGFGISQILPILTLILNSNRNDVILIENPEVHLHPKLQAHFVDLCVYAMRNGRKLIVETHSEHIINRIRLRIKQNEQLLKWINILFFEKIEGYIRSTEIEITPEGKLSYWPKNFFDQSYYDLLGLIQE